MADIITFNKVNSLYISDCPTGRNINKVIFVSTFFINYNEFHYNSFADSNRVFDFFFLSY